MKRLAVMLLSVALLLSVTACGGTGGASNAVSEDDLIGTWEREFTNSDGEEIGQILEIYKGGTGHFTITHDNGEGDNNYDGTWEMEDDVLNFTYTFVTIGLTFDPSSDPVSLVRVDDSSAIFYKAG